MVSSTKQQVVQFESFKSYIYIYILHTYKFYLFSGSLNKNTRLNLFCISIGLVHLLSIFYYDFLQNSEFFSIYYNWIKSLGLLLKSCHYISWSLSEILTVVVVNYLKVLDRSLSDSSVEV